MSITSGKISTPNFQSPNFGWIRNKLLDWGIENYKEYPWRTTSNLWLGLIAEIFLQRTRVKNVIPVYLEFEKIFKSPEDITSENAEIVYKILFPLGLRWRAKKIVDLALKVAGENGEIPKNKDDLVNLPGVGEYVASAWLCFHADTPSLLVDNNITRWLAKYFGMEYSPESRRDKRYIDLVMALTPFAMPLNKKFNYAVLDFTMNICIKKPNCAICPLIGNCIYQNQTRKFQ